MDKLTVGNEVPHPAFRDPNSDVVIVAKDGVEFHVHKLFLTVPSDFFRNMFEHPQPTAVDDDSSTLPTRIPWDETAAATDKLLRYIYPVAQKPEFSVYDLAEILTLIKTAQKWQIDVAVTALSRELLAPQFLQNSYRSMQIYLFACRYALDDVREAALNSAFQIDPLQAWIRNDLTGVDGRDIARIAALKELRGEAIQVVIKRCLSFLDSACNHPDQKWKVYNRHLIKERLLSMELEKSSPRAAFGSVDLFLALLSPPQGEARCTLLCDLCYAHLKSCVWDLKCLAEQVTSSAAATESYERVIDEYYEAKDASQDYDD